MFSRPGQESEEQTPLLHTSAQSPHYRSVNASAKKVEHGAIEAAETDNPLSSESSHSASLSKLPGFPSGHWLAPEEGDEILQGAENAETNGRQHHLLVDISTTRFWCIFGGILVAYFIALFDATLMASSHPVITSYFNASNSASWLSAAFLLTATSLQPLCGRISDTIGRRPLYLFGLICLAAATLWCALAQSIGSFIAARAFCGLGAAGVLAMGSITTNDLVSIEVRGTYQAYINLFYGLGSACGAAFGGFLCDLLGWRTAFFVQIPPILCVIVNAISTTPASLGPHLAKHSNMGASDLNKGFDFVGSVFLTTSVALLILGLNLGGNVYPWDHPLVITSLIVALVSGATLIYIESRADLPVLPMKLLSSQPRASLVFNNFFSNIGTNTVLFNAPLYFQAVKGDSPTQSGFRLAGPSIALTVCGVSSGFIMTATGRMKELLIVGSLCMLIGGICLSLMWEDIPTWLATIFVAPAPLGQGITFPATSLAVLATSKKEDQAVMTSTLTLWRSLGTVMGVSFSSLILQNALNAYLAKFVTGREEDEIIEKVRKSVRAINDLDLVTKTQVVDAYSQSLKVTFISSIVMFAICNALIVYIKLPRLQRR